MPVYEYSTEGGRVTLNVASSTDPQSLTVTEVFDRSGRLLGYMPTSTSPHLARCVGSSEPGAGEPAVPVAAVPALADPTQAPPPTATAPRQTPQPPPVSIFDDPKHLPAASEERFLCGLQVDSCGSIRLEFDAFLKALHPNDMDRQGFTPVARAARYGMLSTLLELLDHPEANPATPCAGGQLPLLLAVEGGHLDCVRALLDHFLTNNISANKSGRCLLNPYYHHPLTLALLHNDEACIKLLLEYPQVIAVSGPYQDRCAARPGPLDNATSYAVKLNRHRVLNLLLDNSQKTMKCEEWRSHLLYLVRCAVYHDAVESLNVICSRITAGDSLEMKPAYSPMHLACALNRRRILPALLSRFPQWQGVATDADFVQRHRDIPDNVKLRFRDASSTYTPLMFAILADADECAQQLLSYPKSGLNLAHTLDNGDTVLHLAIEGDKMQVLMCLMMSDAKLMSAANKEGLTPKHLILGKGTSRRLLEAIGTKVLQQWCNGPEGIALRKYAGQKMPPALYQEFVTLAGAKQLEL